MDLILWRHADAEDGSPDLERKLTKKGRQQAAAMAKWLEARLPGDYVLLSSPAARARETAAALSKDFRVDKTLAPGAAVADILKAAKGLPFAIIVGHQPDLGCALAFLLAG